MKVRKCVWIKNNLRTFKPWNCLKFKNIEGFLKKMTFLCPPCFWFSSLWHDALRYKIYDFLPYRAMKQYIIGLNSVKLCCSNWISTFGTTKSVKSSKNTPVYLSSESRQMKEETFNNHHWWSSLMSLSFHRFDIIVSTFFLTLFWSFTSSMITLCFHRFAIVVSTIFPTWF